MVDAAVMHKPTSLPDAPVFGLVLRLMVVTQRHCSAIAAGYSPRITGIGYKDLIVSDKANVSSRPCNLFLTFHFLPIADTNVMLDNA